MKKKIKKNAPTNNKTKKTSKKKEETKRGISEKKGVPTAD
jgi:hypothetical protein